MTCEFVTISTSNNRSRIVILIYNILYIYIKYYYLLFIIYDLIILPHLPSSILNLLNVTNSHVTKYNSQNVSFLIRLTVFRGVQTVRSFVCSLQTTRFTTPRFANYGTLRYKLWQFLVESASNADSGNVILWERERQTLVVSTAFSVF